MKIISANQQEHTSKAVVQWLIQQIIVEPNSVPAVSSVLGIQQQIYTLGGIRDMERNKSGKENLKSVSISVWEGQDAVLNREARGNFSERQNVSKGL